MMASGDERALVRHIQAIETILGAHATALGGDFVSYRNHVYRVANGCLAMSGRDDALEKIGVAAAFHDLGIWTDDTFDYIAPSVALARGYLVAQGRDEWIAEIDRMIADHHKITASTDSAQSLVEAFRRADWLDVTLGFRGFGVSRRFVGRLFDAWPSAGFHRRLVTLTIGRWSRHPLTPLPMIKW